MKFDMPVYLGKLAKKHRLKKRWQKTVSVMAAAVVFTTTYAMILPAITAEGEPICGREEHIHDDSCYDFKLVGPEPELVCEYADGSGGESVIHTHNKYCYDDRGELICGLSELDEHIHDEDCYTTSRTLICDLDEDYHVHTNKCYSMVRGDLICGEEKTEGHIHDSSCYMTEEELTCGLEESEEHIHDASCYSTTEKLVCTTEEESPHTHSDNCYDWEPVLNCSLEENPDGHEHTDDCYEVHTSLSCGRRELTEHTHSDGCYDEGGSLICGKTEAKAHQHTSDCVYRPEGAYKGAKVLICDEEEHEHTDECYPSAEDEEYYCGLEEHTHNTFCYDNDREVICDIKEHTHTSKCLIPESDSTADVETADDWEETLSGVELSGIWADDLVEIAESQLGYLESSRNYVEDSDGTRRGYTRYGDWYGDTYGDWCAMFVSFCLNYAEIDALPYEANCRKWVDILSDEDYDLYREADEYTPKKGDLVFFNNRDTDSYADHVGIVEEYKKEGILTSAKIKTIEGNSADRVRRVTYDLDDARILGYAELPENPDAEYEYICGITEHIHGVDCYDSEYTLICGMEEHIHSEECRSAEQGNLNMILPEGAQIPDGYDANYSYIDPDNRFGVMVYAAEDALPENAVLSAELLEQESEAYEAAQLALTDTEYDGFAALDIHFTVDGEEIEPEGSVYVCINVMGLLPEEADKASLAVQHHRLSDIESMTPEEESFTDIAVETVADAAEETGQVEVLDNGAETTADVAAAFEVESFSTFTITWGYTSDYVLNIHYIDTTGNDIAPSGIVKNFETVVNTANVTMSNYADMIDHPGCVYQYAYIDNGGVKTAVNKLSYNTSSWYFTTRFTTDPNDDDWKLWANSEGKTPMDVYLVYQQIDMDNTVNITWQDGEYTLYLHYVDINGNPLQIDTSQTYVDSVAGVGNIAVSDYAGLVYPASYQYQNAYIEVNNAQTEVARISYNATRGCWCITTPEGDGSDQWLSWSGSETEVYNETQAHVYLRFAMDSSAYYYAQPIHNNIKLTLYDYGSYINTGDNKVIPFYQAMGGHSSIDGMQVDALEEEDKKAWPPTMEPMLNAAGYPQVSSGRSLEYLFRKGGLPLNTGNAADPLTKYADMRSKATWNQGEDKYASGVGYQTQYESMRFDLGSDGGLFHVDADGYYIYNCDEQSAYYNQDTNRFELSDTLIDVGHNTGTYKNFLPFDKIDPALGGSFNVDNKIYKLPYSETEDKRSGIADLWFGMTMKVDFYMPGSGKVNGEDMIFEFQGDDDVWVYIDDVLVLDIGGCHGARNGSINFATGNVVYPNPADDGETTINTTLKALFTNAGASTASFGNSDTFIDWTEHTLKFYYMERGGNISSCHLKFNLPTRPDKALMVAKDLTAANDADADVIEHLENTMEYKFRVVKVDESGDATDQLLIKEGDPYTVSGEGLAKNETRLVGKDGYFTLKAGQMAEFDDMLARFDQTDINKGYVVQEVLPNGLTGQYQDVVYSVGSDTGTCKNDATTVETDFIGYNSPAQDAAIGNIVSYTNKVDTERLSTLAITKTIVGSHAGGQSENYYMQVKLGPDANSLVPLSVGTTYYVDNEARTVDTEGIIRLKAGETANIKLLAGTCYSVTEVADGDGNPLTGNEVYTPTYSNNANGTVTQVNSTVEITVTNTMCYELPSTGGTGTAIYYISGGAVLILGSVLLLYRRTKEW